MTDVYKAFIGGQWVDASSGETFDVYNPATDQVFAQVAKCTVEEDVNKAVKAAAAAAPGWAMTPMSARAKCCSASRSL